MILAGACWWQWTRFTSLFRCISRTGRPSVIQFGAQNFALGLAALASVQFSAWRSLEQSITLGLCCCALWATATLLTCEAVRGAARQLDPDLALFGCAGALLLIGSFATAQNSNYRAIHLLLAMPALYAVARGSLRGWLRASVSIVWPRPFSRCGPNGSGSHWAWPQKRLDQLAAHPVVLGRTGGSLVVVNHHTCGRCSGRSRCRHLR